MSPLLLPLLLLSQFVPSRPGHPKCPEEHKYGPGPPEHCPGHVDPGRRPPSPLEEWFSEEMFADLFPFANLGWGPHRCSPYSYEAFAIAARYFPRFGAESPAGNGLGYVENTRRDLAAFLAHAVQETGLNDISLYERRSEVLNESQADDCFYRGGLFNWFEGGPISAFLDQKSPGYKPEDGDKCLQSGRYCSPSSFYKCGNASEGNYFRSCYLGRGPIQISYNYNYAQFGDWLASQNISVDLVEQPNLVLTKRNPPLALMASLWFYMTPQPPKPSMHDIVLGQWHAGPENQAAGYSGPIFGPTSLVINNECTGEDTHSPGGGGENRRIRAFKWFCRHFKVPFGNETTLTCKKMPRRFDQMSLNVSWEPDWASTWRDDQPCRCAPAAYGGPVPYFQPGFFPEHFVQQNEANGKKCQQLLYKFPSSFGLDLGSSGCLNLTSTGNNTKEEMKQVNGTNKTAIGEMPKKEGEEGKKLVESGHFVKRVVAFPQAGQGSTNYLHPDIASLLVG